tara:strand:+ start:1472 stop:3664 length:2193 start_codon:yes stop_codon:yes gene_type:complete
MGVAESYNIEAGPEDSSLAKKWDWEGEIKNNEYLNPIQIRIIERLHDPTYVPFKLDSSFVDYYATQKPNFGFNGAGEVTYLRTYSRAKPEGGKERWHDTIERVVNGTFNLQKRWITSRGLDWDDYKAKEHAEEMYKRIFEMKFLPPGRGLWAMGSEITEERGTYAALNNSAFVSTENIKEDLAKPFTFLMDMSMLGVGVGFDTRGAGRILVKGPDYRRDPERFSVPDTREGWVESVRRQIESYFLGTAPMEFNYDELRTRGELIGGFGGKASGPEPLEELHESLGDVLEKNKERPISVTSIVDLQNIIGKCVVAGNVRRTAEIALGMSGDEEFYDLKDYEKNPNRSEWGWASNNSVLAEIGMDYSEIEERIRKKGEPGLVWLDNMRAFGRMGDPANNKDRRVMGANPCVEQSLESYELCNLVETFPDHHENLDDFLRTQKFAYMYGKTVALAETHCAETNKVLLRNRRIGLSMSGISQFVARRGLDELLEWSEAAYERVQKHDEVYSDEWFAVPRSIKTTSIKPSGTVSLVAGATPGMHWPISEYHIRRITIARGNELLEPLEKAGYNIIDSPTDPNSVLAEFPVHIGEGIRSEEDVSMWEQLNLVALLQERWADNQVSSTIKFDPETEGHQIAHALDYFQYRLKGISMLPKAEGIYKSPPLEKITKEEYLDRTRNLKELNFSEYELQGDGEGERFCNTDSCEISVANFKREDNENKSLPNVNLETPRES